MLPTGWADLTFAAYSCDQLITNFFVWEIASEKCRRRPKMDSLLLGSSNGALRQCYSGRLQQNGRQPTHRHPLAIVQRVRQGL